MSIFLRKIVALTMIFIMLFSSTHYIIADTYSEINQPEIMDFSEQGFILERYREHEKVTVIVKNLEEETENVLVLRGNDIYLDGELFSNKVVMLDLENSLQKPAIDPPLISVNATTWGSWQNGETITINTGGLTTAVICGLIALKAGWCPVGVVSAVAAAVAGKYDVLKIKCKIRYGYDSTYYYYERQTRFYGDGKLIYGPYTDKGKTPLNGSGANSVDFIGVV